MTQLFGIYKSIYGYFAVAPSILSSSLDVRQEKLLSFGVFSYLPQNTELDYGSTFKDTGSFEVDILDNTYIQKSYVGDTEKEKNFHFLSGLASSELESSIVEQFTGEQAVSTVAVFNEAAEQGVNLIYITEKNLDDLNGLNLYSEDKAIIRQAVADGGRVIVPVRNIKIDNWTGAGYIIRNEDTGDLVFKITGALNGGSTPNVMDSTAMKALIVGCGMVAFVDTVISIYQSIQMITSAIIALQAASGALSIIGGVIGVGVGIAFLVMAITSFEKTVDAMFAALEGDPDAAMELLIDTGLAVLSKLGSMTTKALKNKIVKKFLSNYSDDFVKKAKLALDGSDEAAAKFLKKAKKSGVTDDALDLLFDNCKNIDDIKPLFKTLGKLDGKAQKAIAEQFGKKCDDFFKILKKYDDDVIEKFLKRFEKDGDELLKKLANSDMLDDAVEMITKYGDYCAKVVEKYGDDALKAIKKAESVKSVDAAIKAIDKYGDVAIDAFKKATPSQECADFILKYGKDAADVFAEYGDDAVEALTHCTSDQRNALIVISAYADDGISALKKDINPGQISTLESHGITPNEYFGNRRITSPERAQKIIDDYVKLHEKFTAEEIATLKNNVVAMENTLKQTEGMTNKKMGPAVCGVYNKKTGEFFYNINAVENVVPSDGVKLIDDRIADMPEDIYNLYKDKTIGKGTHA